MTIEYDVGGCCSLPTERTDCALFAVGSAARRPTALEPPENVQIAVARASAVSHARDVDVCPVRLEVLLHLSLGTGGRRARRCARAIAKTTFLQRRSRWNRSANMRKLANITWACHQCPRGAFRSNAWRVWLLARRPSVSGSGSGASSARRALAFRALCSCPSSLRRSG